MTYQPFNCSVVSKKYDHTINGMIKNHAINAVKLQRFIVVYEPNVDEIAHALIEFFRIEAPTFLRRLYRMHKKFIRYHPQLKDRCVWWKVQQEEYGLSINYEHDLAKISIFKAGIEAYINESAFHEYRWVYRCTGDTDIDSYILSAGYIVQYSKANQGAGFCHRGLPYLIWVHMYLWLKRNHPQRLVNL